MGPADTRAEGPAGPLRGWRCLLLAGLPAGGGAWARDPEPPRAPPRLRPPIRPPPCPRPPLDAAAFQDGRALPIDLPTALRLAETANLDIAQAAEFVNRARIALTRARIQLVPNVNIGSTYVHHEGAIQRTE